MNACGGFSEWFPLDEEGVARNAPVGPAAVQVRVAKGLLPYPTGKSAMVLYFYAEHDAKAALHRLLSDEIERPGARGLGPLWFRVLEGPNAREELERRYAEFLGRFGAPPRFHPDG